MKVWNIRTNWGGKNIFPVFKKHKIAFAGTIDQYLQSINQGDLFSITNGQTIVAVGQVESLDDLEYFDPAYVNEFRDIKCVRFSSFYSKEDYPTTDFGAYGGQAQLHQAQGDYPKKIIKLFNQLNGLAMLTELKELLEHKHQIILQGPPGTGKTFTAEKIAKQLAQKKTISKEDIQKLLSVGQTINSCTDYTTYVIDAFTNNGVRVKLTNGNTYEPKYSEITASFERKTWVNGQVKNGNDSYSAAIAKYVEEHLENDQIKLIQFHPAYSYEDFVRGITVQNNGTQIEYLTQNKVLGEFATKAHENFLNSKKEASTLAYEAWLASEWQAFVEEVQEEIDKNGKYDITSNVQISEVDNDAFRYSGKAWATEHGHRMKFSDVLQGYTANVDSRAAYKALPNTSGSAKQHTSYYFTILTKFKTFRQARPNYQPTLVTKEEEKNYVLIIDEINRANLPAVLGELIYALEYRGRSVDSMYAIDGNNSLVLPPNFYIIGTMNTADRSVGHIDYAIRRRFAFRDILPSDDVIKSVVPDTNQLRDKALKLYSDVAALFAKGNIAADFKAKDVQLGHSYFMADTEEKLKLKLEYEIKPILREYLKDGILLEGIAIESAGNKESFSTEDYIDNLKVQ